MIRRRKLGLVTFPPSFLIRAVVATRHLFPGSMRLSARGPAAQPEIRRSESSDLSQALRAIGRIEAGTVWVNRYGRSRDHILPTGGYKSSGIGKDLGKEAFEANRRRKSVLIEL